MPRHKTLFSRTVGFQTPGVGHKLGRGLTTTKRNKKGWFVVGRPAGKLTRAKKRHY
jgi:hypothetical protein